jgi:hypothetical protein
MKEIRKQKKKKKKIKRKRIKGSGNPSAQLKELARGPSRHSRTGTLYFPFLSLTGGSHLSGHVTFFLLQPNFTPEIAEPKISPPLQYSLTPARFDHLPSL